MTNINQELLNEIIKLNIDADELLAAIEARKQELVVRVKCPTCGCTRIGYYQSDSDWHHGHIRWRAANPDLDHYTQKQRDGFDSGEHPDIEIYICLQCRYAWNTD